MNRNLTTAAALCCLLSVGLAVDVRTADAASQPDRELSSNGFAEARMLDRARAIGVESIREDVLDFHENVKFCIEDELDRPKGEVLPFAEIMRVCVGDNYTIVLRFYQDFNYQLRETIKERILKGLPKAFCNDSPDSCLEFFKALEMYIEKDYDLMGGLQRTMAELERKIDRERLETLVSVTEQECGDINAVQLQLFDERRFLSEYFAEKFKAYRKKFSTGSSEKEDARMADEIEKQAHRALLAKMMKV